MADPLRIDVWSDVVCPWCYIGKRNLETALDLYASEDGAVPVEVVYRSFELSPDTPEDFQGNALDYLSKHRGVSEGTARQMIDRVVGIAEEAGLAYDYDSIQHTNTVNAHQVIHHARTVGLQVEMKERLLKAYFVEGRHIGLREELAAMAGEVGIDPGEVLSALDESRFLSDVRADQRLAAELGIGGVPFFVFDMSYGISGAHPPESLHRAITHATSVSAS
jgi:predicted DsbA family dithiol-disulfide isomerase